MTHYVCEECIKCKYKDCVDVCPVDCFYEGENTLVIDPDTCIDCGVCIPECPVDAIRSDIEGEIDSFWIKFNKKFSSIWPNVTEKGNPHPDAEEFKNKKNKINIIRNINLDD